MINKVEKQYDYNGTFCSYLITYNDNSEWCVPWNATDNRHYQEIQEWIADGGTVIDNGGGE